MISAVKSFYFLEEHDALGGLEKVGTMLDKARYLSLIHIFLERAVLHSPLFLSFVVNLLCNYSPEQLGFYLYEFHQRLLDTLFFRVL